MAETINPTTGLPPVPTVTYIPSEKDSDARVLVVNEYLKGRINSDKSYNQFNGRTLYEFIDDGTKRWNGYIPEASPLVDDDQSRIFINYTRNQIISYLVKVVMTRVEAKIKAVNKRTGALDQKFADALRDMNRYSLDAENGDARYMEIGLETSTKGTCIVYEGYRRETQEVDVPQSYDPETGKIVTKKETRLIFDNCFQQVVPLEDFYIANPYEPDLQKQPFVCWRQITTYLEAKRDWGKYSDWEYVKAGSYTLMGDPTTFYRNKVYTDLSLDQVEVVRYYSRKNNKFVVMVNGVIMYNGAIPFRDGKYPFAKYIFEPFENAFFWGSHFPNKIMGLQDEINTQINMMNDKQAASLLPYGLSSDVDDLIEDDVLQPNKIRKVGDISKWKFDTLPGVSAGEITMFQTIMNLAEEDAGDVQGAGNAVTPRGGKLPVRQVMMKQQEAMQKLTFSMNFMEDGERDRTELRLGHILQFYSVYKVQKITGKKDEDLKQMMSRDIRIDNVKLPDGRNGTKLIRLIDGSQLAKPGAKQALQDQLSVEEAKGDITGQPTYAIAMPVDAFYDYNFEVQVVKNSSYERNEVLDQAVRHEYANWRLGLLQFGVDVDKQELVDWVDESYDIDSDRFKPKAPQPGQQMPGMPGQQPGGPAGQQQLMQGQMPQAAETKGPAKQMAPTKVPAMGAMM